MDHATDKRLDPDSDVQPTGTTDLRGSVLPELDPLAEGNEIQGHAAAPDVDPTPTPLTADWGETLVRQSLTDLENEMTADVHLSHGVAYRTEEPEGAGTETRSANLEEAPLPLHGR